MVVEFTVVTDITKTLSNGKMITIVKDAKILRSFNSEGVLYQDFINSKGKVVKKYTTIIYGNEYLKVDHSIEEVKRKLGHYEIAGYAGKASYAKKSNKNKRV